LQIVKIAEKFASAPTILGSLYTPLLADSGNWHTATNFSDLQQETYSCYWFDGGKPISATS
jgi:hypothetical protein